MSYHSEAYKMQPPPHHFDARKNDDENLKCWEEIKAETGFSSYKSYLEALQEIGPRFKGLLRDLELYGHRPYALGEIFVLDILRDGTTSTSLRMSWGSDSANGIPLNCPKSQPSTRLLQNLRSPPKNVPARIVLWSISDSRALSSDLVDALGLGLDVHPSFFETLYGIMSDKFSPLKLIGSEIVVIGDVVAAVTRQYRLEGHAPPVLLIAGNCNFYDLNPDIAFIHGRSDHVYRDTAKEMFEEEIGGGESLHHWRPDVSASAQSNKYLKLLSKYDLKDCNVDLEDDTMLLSAMLPLLHMETLRLRIQSGILQSALLEVEVQTEREHFTSEFDKERAYVRVEKHRFWLRRRLQGLEESRNHFVKIVRSQNATTWLESRKWLSQNVNITEVISEARAKEVEAFDYMQLQMGRLSIQESRKSIQLSNQQIDEAKRGEKGYSTIPMASR